MLEHRLFTPLLKKKNSSHQLQLINPNLLKTFSTTIDNDTDYLKVNNETNSNKFSTNELSHTIEQTNNDSSNNKNSNNDPNELFTIVPVQNDKNIL